MHLKFYYVRTKYVLSYYFLMISWRYLGLNIAAISSLSCSSFFSIYIFLLSIRTLLVNLVLESVLLFPLSVVVSVTTFALL